MSTLTDSLNRASEQEDNAGRKAVISMTQKSGSESGLYRAIAELAGAVSDELRPDPDAVLAAFTDLAVDHLRCVHHCGVMLTDDKGRLRSVAATDDYACDIQEIQQESRCGPCLQAASRHHSIRI